MTEQLYRDDHDTLLAPVVLVAGVEYRKVVPVTIDYEAAGEEVWTLIQTMPPTPPGQTEPSKVHMEWMGKSVFDAALGGDDDTTD